MQKNKIGPDGFLQLTLQIAASRLKGKLVFVKVSLQAFSTNRLSAMCLRVSFDVNVQGWPNGNYSSMYKGSRRGSQTIRRGQIFLGCPLKLFQKIKNLILFLINPQLNSAEESEEKYFF